MFKKILTFLSSFTLFLIAWPVLGQTAKTYTPLEPEFFTQGLKIDNVNNLTSQALPEYINQLFKITIGIAAVLAVGQLIHAGILYMTTESWGEKSKAKSIITDAFWGILLIAAAWLILYEINPQLVSLTIFTSQSQ